MRLGEILVGRGLVSLADIARAEERQRQRGGRLGENLIALSLITAEQLDGVLTETPSAPRTVAETGIAANVLIALMLKFMYEHKKETIIELSQSMKLIPTIIQELLDDAIRRQLVQAVGSTTIGIVLQIRYALSDRGRAVATEALNQNLYIGPAPVPLAAYQEQILRQRITNEIIDAARLKAAFEDLIVHEPFLAKIGPAINAGRTILLFGPPGNGKTTIAMRVAEIFRQSICIPYAVDIDGQILKVFDPNLHRPSLTPSNTAALAGHDDMRRDLFDGRWVLCKRPAVVTGGELTLDMLDLKMDESTGFYEAPLHVKALNGTLIIDDLGRQQVSPEQLLNRWIVPMENRFDYLKLHTGKSFMLPFDELLIFSTNLAPDDLMDPAFLRRIPYKIKLFEPTKEEFKAIFGMFAQNYGLVLDDATFEEIVHQITHHGYELAYYQPKFICDQIVATCKYEGIPLSFAPERVHQALSNLYVKIANAEHA